MCSRRSISRFLASAQRDISKRACTSLQPKPSASLNCWAKPAAYIISFLGTQPRITQVPPNRSASTIATLAPCAAARREPATPPEPPPITIRSWVISMKVSALALEKTERRRLSGAPCSQSLELRATAGTTRQSPPPALRQQRFLTGVASALPHLSSPEGSAGAEPSTLQPGEI